MTQLERAFLDLTRYLDQLNLPYVVGGSFASSTFGIPRSTLDVDLVVDLTPDQAFQLATIAAPDFATDPDHARQAVAANRSFNLLHMTAVYKFDIFPATFFLHGAQQISRRILVEGTALAQSERVPILSPEDVLLSKLAWYRLGGETSERQWNDLQGIWQMQQENLDREYLRSWAQMMKTVDLLERLGSI